MVAAILHEFYLQNHLNKLRRAGLYPNTGQATMADVHRLLQSNQRILAIRCYREIHHVGITEAKRAGEALRTT